MTETRPIDSSNPLLDAALACADRGWNVVSVHTAPNGRCSCGDANCSKPGKHPADTVHGIYDATTDEAKIREMWRKRPDANVGVVVGRLSGILGVDIDSRNGGRESIDEIESAHGRMPDTIRSITGGDGIHGFFRLPDGVSGQCEPLPGVEIYAQAHLFVLPPSRHVSGKQYKWAPDFAPDEMTLAEPPTWILEALAAAEAKRAREKTPNQQGPNLPQIPRGSRHKALIVLAGSLRKRGFSPEAIQAALTVTNRERCPDPLEASEIASISHDIGAKPAGTDPAAEAVTAGQRESKILASVETAATLLDDESCVEPPSMIGDGLAHRGSTLMMAAQGGLGKTWLGLRLAIAVARGEEWLGLPTTKGRVGIISFEMPRWALRKRLRTLCGDDRRCLQDVVTLGREAALGLKLPRDLEIVARIVRENNLDLVILDPFAAFQEIPGDTAEAVGPTLDALLQLANATGAVVLVAHHVPKPVGKERRDPIDLVRGHSRLRDDVDTVLVLQPVQGLRRLTFAKVRHGAEPEPVWITSTGAVTKPPEAAIKQKDRNIGRTLDRLLADPTEYMTAEQLAAKLDLRTDKGKPLALPTVRGYLRELESRGLIEPMPSVRKNDPKAWRAVVVVTEPDESLQHNEET